MGILLGILSTLLDSISIPYWKKSINIANFCNFVLGITGNFISLIFVVLLIAFGFLETDKITILSVSLISISALLAIVRLPLARDLYKKEKISTLLPYKNLNKFIIIIISFIFLSTYYPTSIATFVTTMIAMIVIVLFTIDWKQKAIPKSFGEILAWQGLQAAQTLLIGISVAITSGIMYYIIYIPIVTFLMVLLAIKNKNIKRIKSLPKEFFMNRFFSAITGDLGYIIMLLIMAQFGIIITILLSFLGMGMTIIFSYFVLGEKPGKKDIVLTVIVSLLVVIGYYLN